MNPVDEYMLNNTTPTQKVALEKIRAFIKKTVPEVEEVVSYGMPTFRYKGKNLMHIAAFTDHMSLFPTAGPIAELDEELQSFKHAKGTLWFTEDNLIPEATIEKIIAFRRKQIDAK